MAWRSRIPWRSGRAGLIVGPTRRPHRHVSASSARASSSPRPRHRVDDDAAFLGRFLRQEKPPPAGLDYFASIDWARRILERADYEAVPFFSRHLVHGSGENTFFADVVATRATVPHVVSLRRRGLGMPGTSSQAFSDKTPGGPETPPPPDVLCLMALGPGLQSHAGIVHGGFQCVLFDEVVRCLILLHQETHGAAGGERPRDHHFTVRMTTTFHAPLAAPSDVLVRAWLAKKERRKWLAEAELVGGDGTVLTRAETLWITARSKPEGERGSPSGTGTGEIGE